MKSARLILVFALAFSPLLAHATDLSAKKKSNENSQQSANQINWTGFYVGGNLSLNQLANDQAYDIDDDDSFPIVSKSSGAKSLTGIQVGYDKQIDASVIGIQATFDLGKVVSTDKLANGLYPDPIETRVNSLNTLNVRLGYLVQPQLLFYVKGGLARAQFEYEHVVSPTNVGSAEEIRSGWVMGSGIEYAVEKDWSLFFEYNRIDFGNKEVIFNYLDPVTTHNWTNENSMNIVTFGFNYHI